MISRDWLPLSPPAKFASSLEEINSVTRTVVDTHFRDSIADRFDVSGISGRKPLNPHEDPSLGLYITKIVKPFGKQFGFADFNHDYTVASWLQAVNP